MKNFILLLLLIPASSKPFFAEWDDWNKRNRNSIIEVITGKKNQTRNDYSDHQEPKLCFDDYVGGVPVEFQKIKEICNSGEISKIKGILLEGLPGTGKTYLVKCLAGEIDALIFTLDAATLMDMYVGSGPKKIKDKFAQARYYSTLTGKPVILFIDEFDSIGSRSGSNDEINSAVIDEKKKVINALLAEIDGFKSDSKVIIIAATNKVDDIDDAFKRPGRFDYIIKVSLPDLEKRKKILNYYTNMATMKIDSSVDIDEIATLTEGFSPADLKQIIDAAILYAEKGVHGNSDYVSKADIVSAVEARRKSLGLNKITFHNNSSKKITFKDIVGGVPQEVADLKAFLENDEAFAAVGADRPKGILFVGPPGTGKTLLAKAVAGEINAAFFDCSASSFVEIFVGTGPKKIRELFAKAEKAILDGVAKKSIIFIDELDAIGSRSNFRMSSEDHKTINELLIQLDGFSSNENIVVIAATNKPEALDSALLRPGRFDYIVNVPLPDYNKRYALLEAYLYGKPRNIANDIDLADFAKKTENFNCAEIKDLINKAAINAARKGNTILTAADMQESYEQLKKMKKFR